MINVLNTFNTDQIIDKVLNKQRTNLPNHDIMSLVEYRELLADDISSDEDIIKRLSYLGAFLSNIIKGELEKSLSNKVKTI